MIFIGKLQHIVVTQAMGKNSFYLGEVGNSSKMNLVLQVTFK